MRLKTPKVNMKRRKALGRRAFLEQSATLLSASAFWKDGEASGVLGERGEAGGGRIVVPLDGVWEIEDSVEPASPPHAFRHSVPVPGLAHLAQPAFQDVDMFWSRQYIWNLVGRGDLPRSMWTSLGKKAAGISKQKRNYFWYRRTFRTRARKEVAILKINKAQFGTAVWVNGKRIGEHMGCFTAGYFDLTDALDWEGENQLVVRVGAHPGVLPAGYPAGTDFEKSKWTPGIYDRVSLLLSDNPVIEMLQVAPRINPPEITVQVRVKNYSGQPRVFDLMHRVMTQVNHERVARARLPHLTIDPGESRTWTEPIPLPGAKLWSPDHPYLYTIESSTGGDSFSARFGMREFRFDTPTKRTQLNNKTYFLRGSNITLHRFFEDPESGSLPWDEGWVRKMLGEIPKQLNWNSFRFCIGPVPEAWLDVADEAGLLIQNEFFVWTGSPQWAGDFSYPPWNAEEMMRQYSDWMRDNWNHPSVAIWDANNETLDDVFAEKIIPAVRGLDLSNRPWENSYNGPQGPNDPVEDHPYLFIRMERPGAELFRMTSLEDVPGLAPNGVRPATGHALINNEYGWLWLNRDGTPTRLTQGVYEKLLGANATAEERFELDAYLLAGLTEFWRAYRNYAGVLHFVYLTSSYPGAFTSDNFRDVKKLELDPHFKDYLTQAFQPLGVYINFWQPQLEAGSKRRFMVMMVNDRERTACGTLALSLERRQPAPPVAGRTQPEAMSGPPVAYLPRTFKIPGLGQQTYHFDLELARDPGEYLLKATATPRGELPSAPTISRRKLSLIAMGRHP